jgi:hypothetical protein
MSIFRNKEPQIDRARPVDFKKLAEEIDRHTAAIKPIAYAGVPVKPDMLEQAKELTLSEVGAFRDLSLAELDRLLEQLEADRAKLLRMAKHFRENIERGHHILEAEIMRHAERCRAANEFFVRFKSAHNEMPGAPAPAPEKPKDDVVNPHKPGV